jgi:hypothetical protein
MFQRSDSHQVCLIDFGLTYRPPKPDSAKQPEPPVLEGPVSVFGTLPYASLNAHEGESMFLRFLYVPVLTGYYCSFRTNIPRRP